MLALCLTVGWACSRSDDEGLAGNASLRFSVSTRTVGDANAFTGEDEFGSLAVYIFHNSNQTPERAILNASVAAAERLLWQDTVAVKQGTKTIYVIGNYAAATLTSSSGTPVTLSATTMRAALEDLKVTGLPVSRNRLLMVARTTVSVSIGDTYKEVPLQLRRLQARIDLYVYKGTSFTSTQVELRNVSLGNLVTASEVKYAYDPASASMPSPLPTTSFSYTPAATRILTSFPGTSAAPMADTIATMYSYQNIITSISPVPSSAPTITVTARYGGTDYVYTGYVADNSQTQWRYSLLQNNIYSVFAVVEDANTLFMRVNGAPWDVTAMNVNRPVTASDIVFSGWAGSWGGANAKTIRTVTNAITDAAFSFELKAPAGTTWVATLTNGLDFSFVSSTSGITGTAVSRGSTRAGVPYLIAVRANNAWTGQTRTSEFYITANGAEVPINAAVNGVRPYGGTSDTRITIKQVFSTAN